MSKESQTGVRLLPGLFSFTFELLLERTKVYTNQSQPEMECNPSSSAYCFVTAG